MPLALPVETRAPTAGAELLGRLPLGADAVIEVDLARLRANTVLAPVMDAVAARGDGSSLGFDPIRDVDVAVAGVYRAGKDDAATLFLLSGRNLANPKLKDAEVLSGGVLAIGSEKWLQAARSASVTMTADPAFMRVRDAAMPERAEGASIRVTARLNDEARIGIAGQLVLDEFPATISIWADVADDAAIIALIGGDDEKQAARLVQAAEKAHERAGKWVPAWLGGAHLLDALRAERQGTVARLTWLLGPHRFAAWATDVSKRIGKRDGT